MEEKEKFNQSKYNYQSWGNGARHRKAWRATGGRAGSPRTRSQARRNIIKKARAPSPPSKGKKAHAHAIGKSGDEMQGNARETRPEPERNQTQNATANSKQQNTQKSKTATNAGEPHPEPHKPAAHAHKLQAVFCLGRIVSASVGGLFALLLFILQYLHIKI